MPRKLKNMYSRRTPKPKKARPKSGSLGPHHELMLELTPVLMRGPDDRIMFWNRASEILYGFSREEALGRLSHELLQTKFPEPLEQILAQLRTGRQWHGELKHRRSNGQEVTVASEWIAYMNEHGALEAIIELNSEITERKRAEEARDRLAAIIEQSDDAIISKNMEGRIKSWNAGAEKLLGYRAEEMVGESILRIIPAELRSEEAGIMERLRRGERVDHFETVRRAKDGRRIDVSLSISPIRNEAGEIIGASKIARDITERKRTEQALRLAQSELKARANDLETVVAEKTKQLRESISELEAFSYSLSHDLRAPLRAINTFTHIVLEEHGAELSPEARELLGKVLGSAGRMDRLMQDVLAFSRVSRQPLELGPVDVEPLVREAVRRPEFQGHGSLIEVTSPLEPMFGHAPSLSQCLTNLLSNALKFVAPGQRARVRIYSEILGDRVRLWVADNGIGIDAADHPKLFELFQRLRGDYEGTGIGLAIVKKAAERMGGKVGVVSAPGQGSRFFIELPRATL